MKSKIGSIVISSILAFALIAGILSTFVNALAQEDDRDTELGGDPEIGGDTGMSISDLENDTEITNGQIMMNN